MQRAHADLRRRLAEASPARAISRHFRTAAAHRTVGAPPELSAYVARIGGYAGPRPPAFEKPRYGTPAYALAMKIGWIAPEEEKADRLAYQQRRLRSLQSCHRYSLYDDEPRHPEPKDTAAFVPELAARLDNDRNLTDGARRCARKIAELTYRQNREDRALDVKVYYLMKALGRSRRTVQRYLRLLERRGYIRVKVIKSQFARMCIGLVVELRDPLFARHHRKSWPQRRPRPTLRKAGASKASHDQASSFSLSYFKAKGLLIPVHSWALRCMDGVYRQTMKTVPPFPAAA
jgi:hypothetical protein